MSYLVLARKWRPRTFAEMVGQEHVVRALSNALTSGRVHHAFLFTGTRGVGKTTVARIFAKSLNCETGVTATPCGECSACREIDAGRFVDLLEVDAASRTKVDQTRELLDNVQYAPTRGRYKVYLIDEVHMLSDHSFNALLKTLEEPPPHVKFLLATTDPQKLPITVVSRCLQFHLKRLPPALTVERMRFILEAEKVNFAPAALPLIARAADGSLRDALSLLDQVLVFGAGQVTEADTRSMLGTIDRGHVVRIAGHLASGAAAAAIAEVAAMEEHAPDYDQVLLELAALLQRVAMHQLVATAPDDETFDAAAVAALAAGMAPQDVQLCYQMALVGRRDLALAPDPRSGFEMTLLRMLAFRPASGRATALESTPRPAVTAQAASAGKPAAAPPPAVTGTGEIDWQALIGQLEIAGAAKQLAQNCAWLGRDGQVIRLRLDRRSIALRTPATEERLLQALVRQFGAETRLLIESDASEAGMTDTPARRQERDQQDKLEATRTALENDPTVRALKDRFGATIEPQSVKPLN